MPGDRRATGLGLLEGNTRDNEDRCQASTESIAKKKKETFVHSQLFFLNNVSGTFGDALTKNFSA